jgi:hypothetical protein
MHISSDGKQQCASVTADGHCVLPLQPCDLQDRNGTAPCRSRGAPFGN